MFSCVSTPESNWSMMNMSAPSRFHGLSKCPSASQVNRDLPSALTISTIWIAPRTPIASGSASMKSLLKFSNVFFSVATGFFMGASMKAYNSFCARRDNARTSRFFDRIPICIS